MHLANGLPAPKSWHFKQVKRLVTHPLRVQVACVLITSTFMGVFFGEVACLGLFELETKAKHLDLGLPIVLRTPAPCLANTGRVQMKGVS